MSILWYSKSWKVDSTLPTWRMGLFAEEYSACKYCTVHKYFVCKFAVYAEEYCVPEERLRLQNQQTDLLSTYSFAPLLSPCSFYVGTHWIWFAFASTGNLQKQWKSFPTVHPLNLMLRSHSWFILNDVNTTNNDSVYIFACSHFIIDPSWSTVDSVDSRNHKLPGLHPTIFQCPHLLQSPYEIKRRINSHLSPNNDLVSETCKFFYGLQWPWTFERLVKE